MKMVSNKAGVVIGVSCRYVPCEPEKEEREEENEGGRGDWLSGRVSDCISILRKFGKADWDILEPKLPIREVPCVPRTGIL